jgi:hypothetical protein
MRYVTGQTITCPFTVAVNGVAHDPATLQVSFLKSATVEDVLTYGGTDDHDSWLTRTAVGSYVWQYTLDAAGQWLIRVRWSDDGFVTCRKGDEQIIAVAQDPHSWVDAPVVQ